jgi:hypothetical protein
VELPLGLERLASLGDDKFVLVREEHEAKTNSLKSVAYELAVGKPLSAKRVIRPSQKGDDGLCDHGLTPDIPISWNDPVRAVLRTAAKRRSLPS